MVNGMVNGMDNGMVDKHRPVGRPPPKRPTRTPDENFSNSLASASETTQRSTFRRLPSCSPAGRPLDDNAVQDSFRDGTPAHRHIGTSQTLLGATGVNDVGSVINAVINDPAHPGFVADRVISE
jgi:hypothetical protein